MCTRHRNCCGAWNLELPSPRDRGVKNVSVTLSLGKVQGRQNWSVIVRIVREQTGVVRDSLLTVDLSGVTLHWFVSLDIISQTVHR